MARIQALVDRVEYKPNWRIEVEQPSTEDINDMWYFQYITLCLEYEGRDPATSAPSTLSWKRVAAVRQLEDMTDGQIVTRVIGGLLRGAEMHEFHEWFKLDGRVVTVARDRPCD